MSLSGNLYVLFTMDCERIRKFSPPGGPETWELSESAIRGYMEALTDHGLLGTFFIVPETAERHRELFLEALKEGFELAMHYHPQSFLDGRYTKYLGEYSYGEQLEQLKKAREAWKRALGLEPKSFRPGNCSANEHTYRILYELGFRQGSTYIPNRNIPKFHAVWVGADPYPHHVNGMDFFEVPITSDIEEAVEKGDPTHLRIEGYNEERLCSLVEKWVRHLIGRKVEVKAIVVVTHNFIDYSDKEGKHRRRLEKLIDFITTTAKRLDLELVPITLRALHEIVDEREI